MSLTWKRERTDVLYIGQSLLGSKCTLDTYTEFSAAIDPAHRKTVKILASCILKKFLDLPEKDDWSEEKLQWESQSEQYKKDKSNHLTGTTYFLILIMVPPQDIDWCQHHKPPPRSYVLVYLDPTTTSPFTLHSV
jgi:hypothetical protein